MPCVVSIRAPILAVITSSLVACGSVAVGSTQQAADPAPTGAASSATALLSTMTPDATMEPPSAPAAPPASNVTTYAITAVASGGPTGTVSATPGSMTVTLRLMVLGLAPRSVHTIHDHLGNCASASASRHLSVLATATADAVGIISFEVAVPMFQAGSGRIVIVYADARAAVITGCAQL